MGTPIDPVTLNQGLAGPLPREEPRDPAARFHPQPSERNQDQVREELEHSMAAGVSRPLTGDEKEAAEGDRGPGERVYAPASERVPRAPQPGDDEIVEHVDPNTPERRAAHDMGLDSGPSASFSAGAMAAGTTTIVASPSTPPAPSTTTYAAYGSAGAADEVGGGRGRWLALGAVVAAGLAGGVGLRWLQDRRERARNKPLTRVQRFQKGVMHATERLPESLSGRGLAAASALTVLLLGRAIQGRSTRDSSGDEGEYEVATRKV